MQKSFKLSCCHNTPFAVTVYFQKFEITECISRRLVQNFQTLRARHTNLVCLWKGWRCFFFFCCFSKGGNKIGDAKFIGRVSRCPRRRTGQRIARSVYRRTAHRGSETTEPNGELASLATRATRSDLLGYFRFLLLATKTGQPQYQTHRIFYIKSLQFSPARLNNTARKSAFINNKFINGFFFQWHFVWKLDIYIGIIN